MGASLAGVQFQVAHSLHCPRHLTVTVNMLWLPGPVQTPMQVGGWLFLPVHQAVGRGCESLVTFNDKCHKPPPFQFDMTRGDSEVTQNLLNIMQKMKVIILLMMGATLTWKRGGVRRKQVEMMSSENPQTMNRNC